MSLLPPPSDEELLRRAEAGRYHGVSAETVRDIQEHQANRLRGLSEAELRAYHAEQRASAAQNQQSSRRSFDENRAIALGPNSPLHAKPRAKPQHPEYDLQVSIVAWCHTGEGSKMFPDLKRLIAVPNAGGYSGGYKENVVRVMRAMAAGVSKGFPDLFLPVPRGVYHGAMLELKREGERPAEEQWDWLRILSADGYYTGWCDRYFAATAFFARYMSLGEDEA